MRGLLADHNAEGHLEALVAVLRGPDWGSLWRELSLRTFQLSDFQLPSNLPDDVLWTFCQERQLILVTGNRNEDGDKSLNQTIRDFSTPESLPVVTLANMVRVLRDSVYRRRAAERLIELLVDIDHLRGTGRSYIP